MHGLDKPEPKSLSKFKNLCQTLDADNSGFIKKDTFLKLLDETMDAQSSKKLGPRDVDWINSNSKFQDKVEYTQVLSSLNLFNDRVQTSRAEKRSTLPLAT